MNKKNICFIGHGKLIDGIIPKLNPHFFKISFTSRTNKFEIVNEELSYLSFDAQKDSFPLRLARENDIFIYSLPPIDWDSFKAIFDLIPADKLIVFTSSISVYQKDQGRIDESGRRLDPNDSLMVRFEDYLIQKYKKLIILRLGGLYSKTRHPIFSLSGKVNLKGGTDFIHLVSHDDVHQAILSLLDQKIESGIFNIISNERLTKKDYYTKIALKLNLAAPIFSDDHKVITNLISNEKSKKVLHLKYQSPTLYNKD